jgi:hypothetical protein
MLLSNSFRPDSRVLKEAEYLQKYGFDITVLCWDRQAELPEGETLSSGVKIIRIQNIRSTAMTSIHCSLGCGMACSTTFPLFMTLMNTILS